MAKRKVQAAVEPSESTETPVMSTEDVVADERQRIADESTSKFLGEEVKNNEVVEEESPIEKKAEEIKKREPELKSEDIEKKIEIDPETMRKEIADQVSKDTVEKITKALTGEEKATQAQKDKYQAAAEDFFTKNGRNPQWHELVPYMVQDAVEMIEKKQQERAQLTATQQKQVAEQNEQKQKAFDAYVDEQLNELHVAGKLNKTDQKARAKLFQTMLEVNEKRVSENKPPIYSVKEIFYEHYKPPTSQPAGYDAPISAGRGNATPDSGEDYSYNEIHNRGFLDFFRKK